MLLALVYAKRLLGAELFLTHVTDVNVPSMTRRHVVGQLAAVLADLVTALTHEPTIHLHCTARFINKGIANKMLLNKSPVLFIATTRKN